MENRIIKFRAYTEEEEMIKVGSIELLTDETYIVNDEIPISNGKLQQFTGLLDKNGKEIFEGDIVEFAIENNIIKGEVEYLENWAMFRISTGKNNGIIHDYQSMGLSEAEKYCNREKFEIIGNIFENPNLIK